MPDEHADPRSAPNPLGGRESLSDETARPEEEDADLADSLADASDSGTSFAPSLPNLLATISLRPSAEAAYSGQSFDDFELLRELGKGASGSVYLARQISLDRLIALKVTQDVGSEARTMASLEHRHIVQVFFEQVDQHQGLRLLCMQYVPGVTLQMLIKQLDGIARTRLFGRDLLAIIERGSDLPALLDTDGVRDRAQLSEFDFTETACWLVARLAEALAFAHRRGVLHRDIKPANILIDSYGRPLLADFSLSLLASDGALSDQPFGGTLPYMAPEHLDAFNPTTETAASVVDERSDIYSLGIVLFELLTGYLPFRIEQPGQAREELLHRMADVRRNERVNLRDYLPEVPDALARTVARCLEPDPQDRYEEAADLAEALDGCRELQYVQSHLPPPGFMVRAMDRAPLVWLLIAAFLPHVVGSSLAGLYGAVRLAGVFSAVEMQRFVVFTVAAIVVSFPFFMAIVAWYIKPVLRAWRSFHGLAQAEASDVYLARQRTLHAPVWAAIIQGIGWICMFAIVALGVSWLADYKIWSEAGHFVVSFSLSAMIAMTYSLLIVQFICLRVVYPRLWPEAQQMRTTAAVELASVPRRIRWLQAGAGAIPLLGAVLLVLDGPDQLTGPGYKTFQGLAVALIILGITGFQFSATMFDVMRRSLSVLTGNAP